MIEPDPQLLTSSKACLRLNWEGWLKPSPTEKNGRLNKIDKTEDSTRHNEKKWKVQQDKKNRRFNKTPKTEGSTRKRKVQQDTTQDIKQKTKYMPQY